MRISKTLTLTAAALSSALVLSACTDSGSTSTTVTETVGAETTAATATTGADNADDTATSSETSASETAAQSSGDDPAFAAIDAVLAEHADGIIVSVDREDDRDTHYDIDVVVGEEVLELEVDQNGAVREDDRDNDDADDVAEANQATVTAADAITQALEQHPDGVLEQAELEEDDGTLAWEIDLDDQNGNDLAELSIPAN